MKPEQVIAAIRKILDDHNVDYDPWSDSLEEIEDLINTFYKSKGL